MGGTVVTGAATTPGFAPSPGRSPDQRAFPRSSRGHIVRHRLHAPFQREAPITIVRGPYKAGKTALVREWLAGYPDEHRADIWVVVDRDSTRATFWPRVREALDADEYDDDFGAVTRAVRSRAGAVVLVLDNFERVVDSNVYDDLAHLLIRCPELRVVLVTRRTTEWEMGRSTPSLDVEVLAWPHLAFDVRETSELMSIRGVEYDPKSLTSATEGSPGLIASAIASLVEAPLTPDELDHHLARSLTPRIRRLLDDRRRRVARLAAVPQLTEGLAETLSPSAEDATEVLSVVETAGLGSWIGEPGERRFRLLRAARLALRAEIAPDEERDALRIAREWFVENDELFMAFLMALESEEMGEAAHIYRHAAAEVRTWPRERIAPAIARVPRQLLAEEPTLLGLLGWCMLGEKSGTSNAMTVLAWAGRRIADDPTRAPADRLFTLAIKSMAERLGGDTEAAIATARFGAIVMDDVEPADDETRDVLPVVAGQFGQSLLARGEFDEAAAVFARGWDPAARGPLSHDVATLLAVTHALRGDITTTEALLRHLPSRPRWVGSRDLYTAPLFHLARAEMHIEHLDFPSAQSELARIARVLDRSEHWPWLVAAQARIDIGTGHPAASLATIEARLRDDASAISRYARGGLAMHHSLLLLARGRPREAEGVLGAEPASDPRIVIARGILHLATGRPLEAYTSAHRALRTPQSPRTRTTLLLVASAARLRTRPAGIDPLVDELAALLTEYGLRYPFTLLTADDQAAVRAALAERDLPRARAAIDTLNGIPSFITAAPPQEQLSARELVVLAELAGTASLGRIAERLFVSQNTVKAQVRSIYRKLGAASREEAVILASEQHLI